MDDIQIEMNIIYRDVYYRNHIFAIYVEVIRQKKIVGSKGKKSKKNW